MPPLTEEQISKLSRFLLLFSLLPLATGIGSRFFINRIVTMPAGDEQLTYQHEGERKESLPPEKVNEEEEPSPQAPKGKTHSATRPVTPFKTFRMRARRLSQPSEKSPAPQPAPQQPSLSPATTAKTSVQIPPVPTPGASQTAPPTTNQAAEKAAQSVAVSPAPQPSPAPVESPASASTQATPVASLSPPASTKKKGEFFLVRFYRWLAHFFIKLPKRKLPLGVALSASANKIIISSCPSGGGEQQCKPSATRTINLSAELKSDEQPPAGLFTYTYEVTGGRLSGDGPSLNWDLSGVSPGIYTVKVKLDVPERLDKRLAKKIKKALERYEISKAYAETTVLVTECHCIAPPRCPVVHILAPNLFPKNGRLTFRADVSEGSDVLDYRWSVSPADIKFKGQSEPAIEISWPHHGPVTVRLDVGGLPLPCNNSASVTANFDDMLPSAWKLDQYDVRGTAVATNHLNNFALTLRQPSSQGYTGYIVSYAPCQEQAEQNAQSVLSFLRNQGIEPSRLAAQTLGCQNVVRIELWLAPNGTTPLLSDFQASPCPSCMSVGTSQNNTGETTGHVSNPQAVPTSSGSNEETEKEKSLTLMDSFVFQYPAAVNIGETNKFIEFHYSRKTGTVTYTKTVNGNSVTVETPFKPVPGAMEGSAATAHEGQRGQVTVSLNSLSFEFSEKTFSFSLDDAEVNEKVLLKPNADAKEKGSVDLDVAVEYFDRKTGAKNSQAQLAGQTIEIKIIGPSIIHVAWASILSASSIFLALSLGFFSFVLKTKQGAIVFGDVYNNFGQVAAMGASALARIFSAKAGQPTEKEKESNDE